MPQRELVDTARAETGPVEADAVRVAIHAPSPLVHAGLAGFVALDPLLRELPRDRIGEADVIVVAVEVADAATLELLRELRDEPDARFLLVVGKQWQAEVSAARRRGVHAVVWWDFCGPDVFVRSVRAVADGGGSGPLPRPGRHVRGARGRNVSRLSEREVDVLRLIAEGRQCDEIAAELAYSERMVRYILYGAMKRMRTRNRAHAVSCAIRAGLI